VTTPYHVKLAPAAYLQLKAFSLKQQKFILRLIEALAVNPRPEIAKKIEGMTGLYAEAINQTRLIYKIEDQEILVLVIK
jgi:mRNA interferase RelE/StbE